MTSNGSWTLGIDFGTSNTVAYVRQGGVEPRPVLTGDGSFRTRSGVFIDTNGALTSGADGYKGLDLAPGRYVESPKEFIRTRTPGLPASGRTVTDIELVGAVIEPIIRQAIQEQQDQLPGRLVLTHPQGWERDQIEKLGDSIASVGLRETEVETLAEPVAAALAVATGVDLPVASKIVVYDLGAGTFDVAVLSRTEDGFEVLKTGGHPSIGGSHFDELILDALASGRLGHQAWWPELMEPSSHELRAAYRTFREQIRTAKETLSTQKFCDIIVPPPIGDRERFHRSELDKLITPDLDTTLEITLQTIAAAGLRPEQITRVFLVGGASKMLEVRRRLAEPPFHWEPKFHNDPQQVVAIGATLKPPVDHRPQLLQDEPKEKPPTIDTEVVAERADGGEAKTPQPEPEPDPRSEPAEVSSGGRDRPRILQRLPDEDQFRSFLTATEHKGHFKSAPATSVQIRSQELTVAVEPAKSTKLTIDQYVDTVKRKGMEPPFMMEVAGVTDGRARWLGPERETPPRQLHQYAIVDNWVVTITLDEPSFRQIKDGFWTVRLEPGAVGVVPVVTIRGIDASEPEERLVLVRTDRKGKGDTLTAIVYPGRTSTSTEDFAAAQIEALRNSQKRTVVGDRVLDQFCGGQQCVRHTVLHRGRGLKRERNELFWHGVVEERPVEISLSGAEPITGAERAAPLKNLIVPAAGP